MLESFASRLWIADGPIVRFAGFPYPTRMAVMQLGDGALVLWSPVALTDALRAAVTALGPVAHILAPNSLHHLFIQEWVEAFPNAQVHAAPGIARKRQDIAVASELTDTPHPAWAGQIDQVVLAGNPVTTEVVFFHRESRTTIFTDLLQQFPPGWHKGWRAWVAKLDLMVEPAPTVPRKFRVAFVNRKAARRDIGMVLDWPTENVLMAHGTPVVGGGQEMLEHAFRWLRLPRG